MRRIFLVLTLVALAVSAAFLVRRFSPIASNGIVTVQGSVLRQGEEVMSEAPLAGVIITASDGTTQVSAKSDATGFFSFQFNPRLIHNSSVVLRFEYPGFTPFETVTDRLGNQLYIVRMSPKLAQPRTGSLKLASAGKAVELRNVQVRYAFKNQSTMPVGSLAKQFEASNIGNVPCQGRLPCSPDGRWKATETILPLDAGDGSNFRNLRVSCLTGPCAFTKVRQDSTAFDRKITVSVLNWSDPTGFLIEADVIRTVVADEIRQMYPFIVGRTMNFALPSGSEGPSIQADVNGQYTIFPLGPALILSWADCAVERSPTQNQVFRCQLKPGYEFK